jgi:hypothetical protein
MLTNVHVPPVEGNICDECGRAHKPATVEGYSQQMGYVDKGAEWLIAIQLAGEHGSRQRNYYFTCWI